MTPTRTDLAHPMVSGYGDHLRNLPARSIIAADIRTGDIIHPIPGSRRTAVVDYVGTTADGWTEIHFVGGGAPRVTRATTIVATIRPVDRRNAERAALVARTAANNRAARSARSADRHGVID